jgi:hypothetical protein
VGEAALPSARPRDIGKTALDENAHKDYRYATLEDNLILRQSSAPAAAGASNSVESCGVTARREGKGKAASLLVFVSGGRCAQDVELEGDERFVLWRPSLRHLRPPATPLKTGLWGLAHYLRILHNRDYAVLMVVRNGKFIHRSSVIPACFRWPFMGVHDLQVSSTWTDPVFRGRGLATKALAKLLVLFRQPGRWFWYVVRVNNAPSVAVCSKAGFSHIGTARRRCWLGSRLLGSFEMEDGAFDGEAMRRIA